MMPKIGSRTRRAALLSVASIPVLALILLCLRRHGRTLDQNIEDTCQLWPHLFVAVCSFVYARWGQHGSRIRQRGWWLIGGSGVFYCIGDLTYFYYTAVLNHDAPFPGWADLSWLVVFPALFMGVFALFGSIPTTGRARLVLDSAIASSSLAALCWYFLVRYIWLQSGISLAGKIVSVAVPIGDVAALFGAVVLLSGRTTNRRLRRSILYLAVGIIGWSFSDVMYSFARLHGTFHSGSWHDLGWPLGSILIGFASLSPFCKGVETESVTTEEAAATTSYVLPNLLRTFAPYLAASLAFGIILYHDYFIEADHQISSSTLLVGQSIMLLVLARQVFTLLENRSLTVQLLAFNETLEQNVARRTEQLSALLRVNTAVNDTLAMEEVLAVGATQTRQALQASAVLIWLQPENGAAKGGAQGGIAIAQGVETCPLLAEYLATLPILNRADTIPLAASLTAGAETLPDAVPVSRTKDANAASLAGWCLRVPLMWQQKPLGMIGVVRYGGSFEAAEVELLQNIGLEIGTALANARLYEEAVAAADFDSVTGLYNHRAVHQRLDRAIEQAGLVGQLAVMMLDMNNFKLFNDTYGHPVGDQVLKRVAQVLQGECPPGAVLGRYGGDEFIVVLPQHSVQTALETAQSVRVRLMEEGFRRAGEERVIPITLSFGIASYPQDSANRHELLTIADSNLYSAKQSDDGIALTTEAQRENRELRTESSFEVLDAMVTAVDNKDRYTRHHSEDVTEYALWIAEEMGLSEETQKIIRIGGLLHDVGKIGVPDEILRKPGRLTPEEYEILKRHPRLGALIVGSIPGMENIVDIVRSHHERWDGRGYPDELRGEEIPLLGRIMAVADAVSAMTTNRPYRRGMDWEVAMKEVEANSGTQFDPDLAVSFLSAAKKRHKPSLKLSVCEEPEQPASHSHAKETELRKAA